MKTKIIAPLLAATLSGAALAAAGPATAAPPLNAGQALPAAAPSLTGLEPVSVNEVLADGSSLAGTFSITQFVVENGQLVAQGVFNGTLTTAAGAVTPITDAVSSVAVASAATDAACDILTLDLGPLHLDVLGLVVDLNEVNLDITAEPGPGNLLGNLLCSVSGLLDKGVGLNGVANILNRLLGV
ncbi:ABC transporter substrate-binding protein [Sinomonas halotolerans]|uniref:ABC transporter substrate-binding protein n=1 Tax=Sinomonas halotolerans TaxID=1644133 RepID=A0ABU9WVG1_9MICC